MNGGIKKYIIYRYHHIKNIYLWYKYIIIFIEWMNKYNYISMV